MPRLKNYDFNGNWTMSCSCLKSSNDFCLYLKSKCLTITYVASNDASWGLITWPYFPFSVTLKQARLVPQDVGSSCEPKCPSCRFFQVSMSNAPLSEAFPDHPSYTFFLTTESFCLYYSIFWFTYYSLIVSS